MENIKDTLQALQDPINPSHYQTDKFQVIVIIESFNLDYHLGNVIKYVLRAGKKGDKIEDLKKARWYLDRVINKDNQSG